MNTRWLWPQMRERTFCCFINYLGLTRISLGVSIDWMCPNIEIHLPFCFIKLGFDTVESWPGPYKAFGISPWSKEKRREKWDQ